MAASDARPVPQKNVAFRFYFPIRKNDGTLITSWTGADSEVSKDGGSFADCTNEATEIDTSGVGYIDLTSAEMNADAVVLKVTVTNTGAVPLTVTFFPEESGDYRIAAGDVRSAVGLASANLDTQLGAIDDFLDTEIAAILADTNELQSDWTNGGRLDLLLDAILADTGTDGVVVNTFTTAGKAEIEAEANDALIAQNLDHLVKSAVDTDFATTVHLNSVIGQLADDGTSATFDRATDSLEAVRNRGDAAWITATGFSTLDAAGVRSAVGLASANLDTQLSAIDDYLDTEVAAILADTNELQTDWANGGRLDLLVDAIKAKTDNLPAAPAATGDIPSAATIADSVWDEARSGHVAAGSFGQGVASVQGNVTGSVASVAANVTIDLTQALSAARALDAIADTSLTLNDAFHCAIAAAAGQETVASTTYTVKTPSTGTTIRTFTLDDDTAPTSRT